MITQTGEEPANSRWWSLPTSRQGQASRTGCHPVEQCGRGVSPDRGPRVSTGTDELVGDLSEIQTLGD